MVIIFSELQKGKWSIYTLIIKSMTLLSLLFPCCMCFGWEFLLHRLWSKHTHTHNIVSLRKHVCHTRLKATAHSTNELFRLLCH